MNPAREHTPAPVPTDARTVLLFGGSFDPPHRGHFELPELVRARLAIDHLLYVPAARSPHKTHSPGAGGPLRTEMLRAATASNPRASVWTEELDRARSHPDTPSFTIETVRELKRQRPDLTLRLLIGADQALSFHRWREAAALLRLAPPAVMLRANADTQNDARAASLINQLAALWGTESARRWASWIVSVPMMDLSATRCRAMLAAWDATPATPELMEAIPEAVLRVLAQENPYRTTV